VGDSPLDQRHGILIVLLPASVGWRWLGAEHAAGSDALGSLPWSFPSPFLLGKGRNCTWLENLDDRSFPVHRQRCVPLPPGTACCHICRTTCPSQRLRKAAARLRGPRSDAPRCPLEGTRLPFPGSRCRCGVLLSDPIPAAPPASEHRAFAEQHHRSGAGRGQQLSWQDALASGAIFEMVLMSLLQGGWMLGRAS